MITKILNVITLSRILCAILIYLILYLESNYSIALFLFFIASFSDFLDGYLARKTNSESVLGEILDPIADKLLIVFVLIGLSINLDSYLIGFISLPSKIKSMPLLISVKLPNFSLVLLPFNLNMRSNHRTLSFFITLKFDMLSRSTSCIIAP